MSLYRLEMDVITGELSQIAQKAYRNDSNPDDVVVLDATETAPSGFTEFDPEAPA